MTMTVVPRGKREAPPRHVRSPAWRFLSSLPVDRRLYRYDIAGSIGHVEMLGACGILSPEDVNSLVQGLREICHEIESGDFPWREDLEDVHTNIEARLTELIGPTGAKIHTARSRNDQVALDERLWLREAIARVQSGVLQLQVTIVDLAAQHVDTLMPGYTHLQRAQPVTLAHHLLAHFWRLARDFDRLTDAHHRANISPLGAGALAGTTLPIDPAKVARRLGFAAAFDNSIDAVSDRDYFAEFVFDLALLAVHLSSLGEEFVQWASSEFAFLEPSEGLGAGSSLMPQKRNPDVAELARAKAARVTGDLVSLLATLKSLPLAYNRDLQEDKAPVFDAANQVLETLEALVAGVPALRFDVARMADAAGDLRTLATDLAEYLVVRGVPFREAHEAIAKFLATSGRKMTAKTLREFDARFGKDVGEVLDPRTSLARRNRPGGPAPQAVRVQLAKTRDLIGLEKYSLSKHAEQVDLIDKIVKGESK